MNVLPLMTGLHQSRTNLLMSKEDIFTEMSERKRRKANVIALNIPESDKAESKDHLEVTGRI